MHFQTKISRICTLLLLYNVVLVLSEIGRLSRSYCELSGRIEPVIADVILGFVEMGTCHLINY